jgi:hypothetical protein
VSEKIVSFVEKECSKVLSSDTIEKIKDCLNNCKASSNTSNETQNNSNGVYNKIPKYVYKLMSLSSEKDLCRIIEIICTNKFHCSTFSEMNDPMEGVYIYEYLAKAKDECAHKKRDEILELIYKKKSRYKICSFSGLKGFKNPAMWGYYTNGFKGIAIKIATKDEVSNIKEVKYNNIKKIKCEETTPEAISSFVEKILTTKLDAWKHEKEYRYLVKNGVDKQYIGKINHVYIGCPYGNTTNYEDIIEKSESLIRYQIYKEILEKFLKLKDIKYKYCFVGEDNKVKN